MLIFIQAMSVFRHAWYEMFLHLHVILAVMAFVGLWYHLDGKPQQKVLLVTLPLWGLDVCPTPMSNSDRSTKANRAETMATRIHRLEKLGQTTYDRDSRTSPRRSGSGRCSRRSLLDVQTRSVYVPVHPIAGHVDFASVLCSLDVD